MQGTVWAGLMCTTTMDKIGKEVYTDPDPSLGEKLMCPLFKWLMISFWQVNVAPQPLHLTPPLIPLLKEKS